MYLTSLKIHKPTNSHALYLSLSLTHRQVHTHTHTQKHTHTSSSLCCWSQLERRLLSAVVVQHSSLRSCQHTSAYVSERRLLSAVAQLGSTRQSMLLQGRFLWISALSSQFSTLAKSRPHPLSRARSLSLVHSLFCSCSLTHFPSLSQPLTDQHTP